MKLTIALLSVLFFAVACTVSYKFTGANIDYSQVQTIAIRNFPNQADLVYPTLAQTFTDELRNKYISQTRLRMVDTGADLELEGEIIGYETTELAVTADARASQTRLTITVRVRYINNKKPSDDLEQNFSGYREYDNRQSLDQVQDELIRLIVNDLTDEIFNATLGNW